MKLIIQFVGSRSALFILERNLPLKRKDFVEIRSSADVRRLRSIPSLSAIIFTISNRFSNLCVAEFKHRVAYSITISSALKSLTDFPTTKRSFITLEPSSYVQLQELGEIYQSSPFHVSMYSRLQPFLFITSSLSAVVSTNSPWLHFLTNFRLCNQLFNGGRYVFILLTAASLGASPNAGSLSSASASTSGAQLH
ncbi:MAG: hypothetical protein ACTS42_01255 [Candidatus Hodgkinia cicadicola]